MVWFVLLGFCLVVFLFVVVVGVLWGGFFGCCWFWFGLVFWSKKNKRIRLPSSY